MSAANEARAERVALMVALAVVPDGCALEGWEVMDLGSSVGVAWREPSGLRNACRVRLREPA